QRITDKEDRMAPTQVTCPACKTALRLPGPVAPGKAIRCLKCKKVFPATGVASPPPVAAAKRPPPPLPVAKIVSPPPSAPPPRPRQGARLKTDRPADGSRARKVRLAAALFGGGAILILVGILVGFTLTGGKGEPNEKKEPPKVAQGDRTPGGSPPG